MITIIPALDIMKAVTDKNIMSDAANYRRTAFDKATELMTTANVEVVLEGNLYSKVSQRLNDDHKSFFESIYKINNAAKNVPQYNIIRSISWVADSEAKTSNVIIISDNVVAHKAQLTNANVVICSPKEFIDCIDEAWSMFKTRRLSSFYDALLVVFFISKDKCVSH